MKIKITILFVMLVSGAFAQTDRKSWREFQSRWKAELTEPYIPQSPNIDTAIGVIDELLILYDEYKQKCMGDTIKAISYEDEYIIDWETYREMVTERQLEKYGYKYRYRWVIATDPFEFEYIFTKEPTLQGFIEYLREERVLNENHP